MHLHRRGCTFHSSVCSSSPELEARHAEQPVHGQIRALSRIHARRFEDRRHVVALRQIDRRGVHSRRVQENRRIFRNIFLQCQEQALSYFRTVRKQRADLVAGTTSAKDAITCKRAVSYKAQCASLRLADPALEKPHAAVMEERQVVCGYRAEWKRGQRNDPCFGICGTDAGPLVADVAVRENEPGLLVVFLLVDHSIETDDTSFEARETGIPDPDAIALAAILWFHYIETQEAEGSAVFHDRDRRNGLIPEQTDQETAGVGRVKAIRVVQPRIPSFRRGQVDGDVDFSARHRSDDVCPFRQSTPYALIFSAAAGTQAVTNVATKLIAARRFATPVFRPSW